MTNTHLSNTLGAINQQTPIIGIWEKRYTFSLELADQNTCYVAREYFVFIGNGKGEYGYSDDSGVADSSQVFRYRTEGNRLILVTKWGEDTYEFYVEDDHILYLRDDTFNYSEEFVRNRVMIGKKECELCF